MVAIDEFPDGPDPWRIDMLGRISWDRSSGYEPKIRVHLSKLATGFENPLFNKSLIPSVHSQCDIGIGQMLFAPMGRVVRHKIPDQLGCKTTQEELKIDTRNCIRTTVGGEFKVGAQRYWTLPSRNYRLGEHFQSLKHANILAFVQPNGRGKQTVVLIPAAEILRMYYFSSSNVFNKLWFGNLSEIIDVEASAMLENGVVRVSLRNGFCIDDAPYMARFLCSKIMRRELANLRKQMQVEQVNRVNGPAQIYTDIGLPFEGETTLVAKAKRIQLVPVNKPPGPNDPWAFLVSEIVECRRAMPFTKVVVQLANANDSVEGTDREKLIEAFVGVAGASGQFKGDDLNLTSAEQPTLKWRAEEFKDLHRRFPSLSHVAVTKSKKEVQKYKAAKAIVSARDVASQWGTGEPGYGATSVGSVVIRPGERTGSPPSVELDSMLEALKKLETHTSIEAVTARLGISTLEAPDFELFEFSRYGRMRSWHRIDGRARRAVIAELKVSGRFYYALEIERKKGDQFATLVLSASNGLPLTDVDLKGFMKKTALTNRWPPAAYRPELRRSRVRHEHNTSDALAEGILGTLGLVET